MKVAGLALGGVEPLSYRGKTVRTGIFKTPTAGPLQLRLQGVEGDVQVDQKHHGGEDKAVYLYSLENLRYWAELRGEPPYAPGQVGENITVADLEDASIHLGDRLEIGEAQIEVTQPRVPCFKLGLKMGDLKFVNQFLRSGRTGFYARVLREGAVRLGDRVTVIHRDPQRVSIPEAMRALEPGPDRTAHLLKVLAVDGLSSAWRKDLEKRLSHSSQGDPHDP